MVAIAEWPGHGLLIIVVLLPIRPSRGCDVVDARPQEARRCLRPRNSGQLRASGENIGVAERSDAARCGNATAYADVRRGR